ncbi:MAG: DoxX family protein [Chloroflexota bacterium]
MRDLARLFVRLAVGGLVAAHGSQKLFGWFGGPGPAGTQGMMENLGMQPPELWAKIAALGEFSGGSLMFLGFLNPIGSLNVAAVMYVATRKVHWKLPVWTSSGGAELPLTNLASALAIALVGPGRFSVDGLLGIRLPGPVRAMAWMATAFGAGMAVRDPALLSKAAESVLSETGGTPEASTPPQAGQVEMETRR